MERRSILLLAAAIAAAVIIGAVFAFVMNNPASPKFISDAELQKKTEQRGEVKAFLSEYPEAGVQFNRNETIRSIDYVTTVDGSAADAGFVYLLKINISTDNSGEIKQLTFTCGKTDGIDVESYTILEGIEEDIRNENCLRL